MVTQPGRERLSRAMGQEIDRLMVFEVNQDRSVDSPFLQREIINTKHPWVQRCDWLSVADDPQEGIVAQPHAEFAGQPRAGLAAKRSGDVLDGAGEPGGSLGANGEQIGQAFGKGALGTGWIIAEKAPHMQEQADRVFADREIARGAAVAAMHTKRWLLTARAGRLR
jgi:hypothetical protein